MEVYTYEVTAYRDAIDFIHRRGAQQIRVYIPDKGVITFDYVFDGETWKRVNPRYFDGADAIKAAQEAIRNPEKTGSVSMADVADETIDKILAAGRAANTAKAAFDAEAGTIATLIERSLDRR